MQKVILNRHLSIISIDIIEIGKKSIIKNKREMLVETSPSVYNDLVTSYASITHDSWP
ncbi:hypothetical protein U14_01957 [Candidatus Moduliflexus flocculans]|uniref:Uncharacterized protein n=1 Tax=Candidatus Moduliflexus flocculans TaxID=1499966 RepID=A0A0S6VWU1_9BACT|nr:hypothetical protein U14_01957 [Candidatus Moduliflexus flocculans]